MSRRVPLESCMRLGRLVAGGIVAGALAGFAAGLLRPRRRGVLPGLAAEADPLTDASWPARESSAGDHFPGRPDDGSDDHGRVPDHGELALAARPSRGSGGAPARGRASGDGQVAG
jgi:hypothetical protein